MKIIECDGLHVAASVETEECEVSSIYCPANFLIYVEKGQPWP